LLSRFREAEKYKGASFDVPFLFVQT